MPDVLIGYTLFLILFIILAWFGYEVITYIFDDIKSRCRKQRGGAKDEL